MEEIVRKHKNERMSQIVIHNRVVYLAGQVYGDFTTGRAPIETQVEGILSQIDALLREAGTSRSRLLSAQILLADVADFGAMNAIWEKWVDRNEPPARTTFGAVLAHPNVRVEITVTAAS